MNTIQRLLALDVGKIKTPTKDVEMKLAKLGGEPWIFSCKAVDPEKVAELQEEALTFKKSQISKIKMYDTKVMTIVKGCPSIFENKEIMDHFKAPTPKELVKILLLAGEMDNLKTEIDKLGGFDEEEEDDIKN